MNIIVEYIHSGYSFIKEQQHIEKSYKKEKTPKKCLEWGKIMNA